jgi:YegS/Rv2252/BmrU family lipid kinase
LLSALLVPICVIFNPTARGGRARRFRQQLDVLGARAVFKPTTGPGAATDFARAAVEEGFNTIVAAGGDGTVNEVVNGLATAADGLKRARLGIIPLGTINVFAKELGLPARPAASWETIVAGREKTIDLPYFEQPGADGQPVRRYFAQLAGAGLDARAIELVSWPLKQRVGPLAYIVAGFRAFAGAQPRITVTGGGPSLTGELVLLGNGRFYGGCVPVFHRADLRDGKLDVRVFPRVTWGALWRWGWTFLLRRPNRGPATPYLQAERFTLTSEVRVPFEVEGDLAGQLPVHVGVLPRALRVIVPRPAR